MAYCPFNCRACVDMSVSILLYSRQIVLVAQRNELHQSVATVLIKQNQFTAVFWSFQLNLMPNVRSQVGCVRLELVTDKSKRGENGRNSRWSLTDNEPSTLFPGVVQFLRPTSGEPASSLSREEPRTSVHGSILPRGASTLCSAARQHAHNIVTRL